MSSSEERRGSASSTKFANLLAHKRNPSDEAAQARRLSHSEMQPKAGFFGNMWNSFAKGHTSPPPVANTNTTSPPKQSIHRTGAGTLG